MSLDLAQFQMRKFRKTLVQVIPRGNGVDLSNIDTSLNFTSDTHGVQIGGVNMIFFNVSDCAIAIGPGAHLGFRTIAIGCDAAANGTFSTERSSAIGYQAGFESGTWLSAIGYRAGANSGDRLGAIGYRAGDGGGDRYAVVGYQAGRSAGDDFVSCGYSSGHGAGSRFVALGVDSGSFISGTAPEGASDFIAIGYAAEVEKEHQLTIGSGASEINEMWLGRGFARPPLIFSDLTSTVFGGSTPDPSAKVAINSTSQGFLPPRMTSADRDAISTPTEGLMVYDTDRNAMTFYNGTEWRELSDSAIS